MGSSVLDVADGEYYKYQYFNALWVIMMLFGSVAALYYIISAVDLLMDLFVREPVSLRKYGANKGYWAVVAGCTDKVGKEIALQLADKGFNLLLLSQEMPKLEHVRKEIEAKAMKAEVHAVDFNCCTKTQWQHIHRIVENKDISVLGNLSHTLTIISVVNNIDTCHSAPVFFDKEDIELCNGMVQANVSAMMNLIRIVVPQMQQRKNGLIINVGSFAAMRSLPFFSVYAGTKSFVKTFSQSLAYELEADGIMVLHVFSFGAIASLIAANKYFPNIASPQQYVHCMFDRLGLRCGAPDSHTSIPYYPHSLLNFISSCLWDPFHAKNVLSGKGYI
ncbi:NAD(P)-binding protein [Coemansia reversa NRRL 1564]|uniref:NAD(P)-binding protein n=1 Tax=Coemansia reversa (strain ATCC 12441 / NRRL 1564) TaxID=763665 RepID=A0A2G5B5X1_COERN|nr:NAD(P)-binding protein [Coemansia reversa NRRL 1564]|eukprot:PIA14408.1 NAD(P)-binding protein [Coemansia reversa NRRL 1564]